MRLDPDLLHRILWRRADRRGRLRVLAMDLADELGITRFTLSRIMNQMAQEGRLRDLGRDGSNQKLWTVVDPEQWAETNGGPPGASEGPRSHRLEGVSVEHPDPNR